MEIVKEPHLDLVSVAAAELFETLSGEELDAATVTHAWASLDKVTRALANLCPNHPAILQHRSALATPIGARR